MNFLIAVTFLSASSTAVAFMAPGSTSGRQASQQQRVVASTEMTETSRKTMERQIYDPLGLYPENSEEKRQGMIRPLEPTLEVRRDIVDPMGLYPKNSPEFLQSWEKEKQKNVAIDRPIYDPMGLYTENTTERQEGKIQLMEPGEEMYRKTKDPLGLYPKDSAEYETSLTLEKESLVSRNRELYDPLGLYPKSSVERQEGQIRALEPRVVNAVKPVLDPMNLYAPYQKKNDEVDENVVMSEALPFVTKPTVLLSGELAGDAGFDPLGFAKSSGDLLWQRQAELKHSRIAMLAAVGWPLSELWDQKLAALLHMKPLLVDGDRVPSLLNGGLAHVNPFYWMGIVAIAGLFEGLEILKQKDGTVSSTFDPLGLFPKDDPVGQNRMELAEIKHGRLAMIAITAFALTEALTKAAVVDVTPFFFHPPF